jgi:hypothetical protein
MDAGTTTTCEGCGDTFTTPGLGRPRRFCNKCAPPKLPGLKICSHGTVHGRPCTGCYGIEVRKRQCRITGGRFIGGPVLRYQGSIAHEQERHDAELRLLAASNLSTDQRAEVKAMLDANHEVSTRQLADGLRRAQAKAVNQ